MHLEDRMPFDQAGFGTSMGNFVDNLVPLGVDPAPPAYLRWGPGPKRAHGSSAPALSMGDGHLPWAARGEQQPQSPPAPQPEPPKPLRDQVQALRLRTS